MKAIHIKNEAIRVAIQGSYGSFHDIASRKFFNAKNIKIIPCDFFEEQFDKLSRRDIDYVVMAIENSLTGSLLPNYILLKESHSRICGEIYLRIEQQLAALSGQCLNDIREICSHPVAIQQCTKFLTPLIKKGVKVTDSIDTALCAKMISNYQLKGIAAICSKNAVDIYQLEIIAKNIETNHRNFTRFLVIANENSSNDFIHNSGLKINKASVCFSLPHKKGSLSQVLSVFSNYNNNLTKIQSLPVVGVEWEYVFYADMMFEDYNHYKQSLEAAKPLINELKILGEYTNGKR